MMAGCCREQDWDVAGVAGAAGLLGLQLDCLRP
jgi:hypothetical protein